MRIRFPVGRTETAIEATRAVAMNPEAMLFDEPTSALDSEMVGEMCWDYERLAKKGIFMIIVTLKWDLQEKWQIG